MFRGIQKGEWLNLFTFIRQKRLRIENLREAEAGPTGARPCNVDLGADIDTGEAHQGRTLSQLCRASSLANLAGGANSCSKLAATAQNNVASRYSGADGCTQCCIDVQYPRSSVLQGLELQLERL